MVFSGSAIRIAKIVSFVGHPLLTTSVFLLFLGSRNSVISLGQSALVIAAVVIPLTLWNLRQTRTRAYANFDVSVRTQRHSMYLVILALMLATMIWLSVSHVAFPFRVGMAFILAMFAIAAVANRRIKVSLHAAVSFYISFAMMIVDVRAGAAFIVISVAVAISRFVLRRHTLAEIAWGAILGVAAGASLLLILEITKP